MVVLGRLSEYRALPGLLAKAYLLLQDLLQNLPEPLFVGIRTIQLTPSKPTHLSSVLSLNVALLAF